MLAKYNLLSKIRRKYIYTRSDGYSHHYANLLNQNFEAIHINEIWNTDITYIITPGGRLYLSVIRDAHDGFVIAYKTSTIQNVRLVIETVKKALKHVKSGTILHSDQGFQYATAAYNLLTTQNGIMPSMSRKATPLDNAPIESFFSALKSECIYLEKPKTMEEARNLIEEYVDFYNYERVQLKHKASPAEVRKKYLSG